MRRDSVKWIGFAAILFCLSAPVAATAQNSDPIFGVDGFQPGRSHYSPLPFEHIDTVSGNLILTFTDLVVPGNAGFNLTFIRAYNSRANLWRFGIAEAPIYWSPNALRPLWPDCGED
jgi:hypothetical protein